jgi:hypothetical protein
MSTEPGGVIEREARDAEQKHADQAHGSAHPMPLMQMLQPKGSAFLPL